MKIQKVSVFAKFLSHFIHVCNYRLHEIEATVFIIYGIISMHAGRQLCCALTG